MATATLEQLNTLAADPILLEATIKGVESCLTMCDTQAKCVGVSTIPTRETGRVTGMIGVHGEVSGFITVNMAEQVAMSAVGGLLSLMFVGGPLFKGLATVIVVGLSIGTLFTLFVLPAIMAVFVERLGVKLAEVPAGDWPHPKWRKPMAYEASLPIANTCNAVI